MTPGPTKQVRIPTLKEQDDIIGAIANESRTLGGFSWGDMRDAVRRGAALGYNLTEFNATRLPPPSPGGTLTYEAIQREWDACDTHPTEFIPLKNTPYTEREFVYRFAHRIFALASLSGSREGREREAREVAERAWDAGWEAWRNGGGISRASLREAFLAHEHPPAVPSGGREPEPQCDRCGQRGVGPHIYVADCLKHLRRAVEALAASVAGEGK